MLGTSNVDGLFKGGNSVVGWSGVFTDGIFTVINFVPYGQLLRRCICKIKILLREVAFVTLVSTCVRGPYAFIQ
jgi:hypothetical protein